MTTPDPEWLRSAPTLTDRIDPASLAGITLQLRPDAQTLIEQAIQQVRPKLEQWLQEELERELRNLIGQHLDDIQTRLQAHLHTFVRETVIDVLTGL